MRTFVIADRKRSRSWYWTIEAQSRRLVVTNDKVGELGTRDRFEVIKHPSAAALQADLQQRVSAKLAAGFVETSYPPLSPTGQALEDALAEDPDDRAAHMAYADYLQELGDPRSEFISVQFALEDEGRPEAERNRLLKRERALLREHRARLLGRMAPFFNAKEKTRYRFARGWLDTLDILFLSVHHARALACAPETRLLRRLIIHDLFTETKGDYPPEDRIPADTSYPAQYVLPSAQFLGNLRVLQVGELEGEVKLSYYGGETLPAFLGRLPRLRELNANVAEVDRGKLLDALVNLPELRTLRLEGFDFGNDGCRELVRSSLLKRLKVLQVRFAYIDDEGARTLARCKDLRTLEHLDLSLNWLTRAGIDALRKTGVNLQAEPQHDRNEDLAEEFELDEGGDWE
jgi:uncharacterized protein (TIGR02996 family)